MVVYVISFLLRCGKLEQSDLFDAKPNHEILNFQGSSYSFYLEGPTSNQPHVYGSVVRYDANLQLIQNVVRPSLSIRQTTHICSGMVCV